MEIDCKHVGGHNDPGARKSLDAVAEEITWDLLSNRGLRAVARHHRNETLLFGLTSSTIRAIHLAGFAETLFETPLQAFRIVTSDL